ncbi:MAG: LysE family transporter [Syntrophomonadaceae bacterium]|nr:LysE family transporter [Syntrophomonadaceae bacterium]
MELAGLFTTAFLVGLSGAVMPGPLLTVTIGETVRHGMVAAPLIILGHLTLELILVAALALGMVNVVKTGASPWMAILGGLFMLWMGWGMMRDVISGRISLPTHNDASGTAAEVKQSRPGNKIDWLLQSRLVLTGGIISLANPYWLLWWATVGLGYTTMALKSGTIGVASFFSGHALSDLVWYLMIGAAVSGGRKFFTDKIYKALLIICGFFLLGIGGYFIHYGVSYIT